MKTEKRVPDFDTTLGEMLRDEREQRRVTQVQLAEKLGVSKMTVSHWVKRNTFIDFQKPLFKGFFFYFHSLDFLEFYFFRIKNVSRHRSRQ